MKNECLFTPEQKQVVIQEYSKFGDFFARQGLLTSWTTYAAYQQTRNFTKKPITKPAHQLGVLFAYYIITKNINYFKQNRQHNYKQYFTNKASNSWAGFAYYIVQNLENASSDEEVEMFFESLYKKLKIN